MSEMKVLFVSERDSFILKSIRKKLEEEGTDSLFVPLTINSIKTAADAGMSGPVYFYIDDAISLDRKSLNFLRDLCADQGLSIYLMGHPEDVESLKKEVFTKGVAGEYYRPVNAKQVAEQIIENVGAQEYRMKLKHILVVDDSGTMLTTIMGWLGGRYRVTPVNSAVNAFTFLAQQRPDLILLDYEMPVCSGAQFLEMLRANPKISDIPVIFLTGNSDEESVRRVLALRPAGYLLKSLPKEKIIGKVDAFFASQNL